MILFFGFVALFVIRAWKAHVWLSVRDRWALITIFAVAITTFVSPLLINSVIEPTAIWLISNATAQASGTGLIAVKNWTFILGPHLMLGINTIMYSYLLYQTRLIPRAIAALGLTGAALIFVAALLEIFGVIQSASVWVGLLAAPIAVYEMILAVWLIVKGFNSSAIASESAGTGNPAERLVLQPVPASS